jgi:two-component system, OmpR family, copper resistance phosphate regulon response regulator CusR
VPSVLVVEDERKLLRNLQRGLEAAGYTVAAAATGDEAQALLATQTFDCLVLDWMLPGRDGLELLADQRRAGDRTPVLLLTARDAVEDRVQGLDRGADDYLVKPFAFAELLARLRALLRRGRADLETVLVAGDLEMDLLERRAVRAGAVLPLRGREFDLLVYLLRHQGSAVTRDMLGRDVWHEPGHALTNVIDVTVTLLRKKLDRPGRPPLIHTVRGVGYCLRAD